MLAPGAHSIIIGAANAAKKRSRDLSNRGPLCMHDTLCI